MTGEGSSIGISSSSSSSKTILKRGGLGYDRGEFLRIVSSTGDSRSLGSTSNLSNGKLARWTDTASTQTRREENGDSKYKKDLSLLSVVRLLLITPIFDS